MNVEKGDRLLFRGAERSSDVPRNGTVTGAPDAHRGRPFPAPFRFRDRPMDISKHLSASLYIFGSFWNLCRSISLSSERRFRVSSISSSLSRTTCEFIIWILPQRFVQRGLGRKYLWCAVGRYSPLLILLQILYAQLRFPNIELFHWI